MHHQKNPHIQNSVLVTLSPDEISGGKDLQQAAISV